MLDIHTHILPAVDDGSKSLKRSMTMLRREARQGVDYVALTPHFYASEESPERFLKRRGESVRMLAQKTSGQSGLPERLVGAEVAYFRGIGRAEGIESLCIGNTRAILIEMPFCRWNASILDELIFLKKCRGMRPILAHAERYMRCQPMGTIGQLCEEGLWIQANTSFFLSWQTALPALWMLKKRRIQFIGSDCHDLKKRAPNMGSAVDLIERRLGDSAIKYLARMERRLLEGE